MDCEGRNKQTAANTAKKQNLRDISPAPLAPKIPIKKSHLGQQSLINTMIYDIYTS